MQMRLSVSLAYLAVAPALAGVVGQPQPRGSVPDYDFNWAVIGDPGNPAYAGEFNDIGGPASERLVGRGSVDYRFRMSTTEVTRAQWFEFAQAYQPFLDNPNQISGLFGDSGDVVGFDENGQLVFALSQAPTNPVRIGWRFAARFVNWLHNDKAITKDAFERGVYDTSTFGEVRDENGDILYFTDQIEHNPDARFWIPTLDEWTKAAHWDPNKNGPGEGGWWLHPGGQDTPLQSGLPGEPGAQTSAGVEGLLSTVPLPVGSFADVNAPWGLLDTSGGAPEWLEEPQLNHLGMRGRFIKNSQVGVPFFDILDDPLFEFRARSPHFGSAGLRLASAVPNPGTLTPFGVGLVALARRRRRR